MVRAAISLVMFGLISLGSSVSAFEQVGQNGPNQNDTKGFKEVLTVRCPLDQDGFGRKVGSVVFSPDSKRIVCNYGGDVRVWDVATGRETLSIKVHSIRGGMSRIAFSPDGKPIAGAGSANDGGRGPSKGLLMVWDAENGKPIMQQSTRFAISAPGHFAARIQGNCQGGQCGTR